MLIDHFKTLAYGRLAGVVAGVFCTLFAAKFNEALSSLHLPDTANLGQVKAAVTLAAGQAFSQAFGAALLAAITTIINPTKSAREEE